MVGQKEKSERDTFILGILVAAVIGFALSIYSTVYYDAFVLGTIRFSDYDHLAMALPAFLLLFCYAFLSFLVNDYKKDRS